MTTTDILKSWLDEHGAIYDVHHIPAGRDYSRNFTIWKKSPSTGVGIAHMWIMVGKQDPRKMLVITINQQGGTRHMNMGDPDFFTVLENII